MVVYGKYYCPACGKTIMCYKNGQIKETDFKDSRVIPLTNLSLVGTPQLHNTIRNEVLDNMDFYYDYIIPDEELSSRMEEVLKNMQDDYQTPQYVLRKNTRKE